MAEETEKRSRLTPVRVNLLVIALLIAILNGGIIYLVYLAITSTALSGLGTTLMNDK